ncbi:MAG: hypothetical protein ACK43K_09935, partial [Chitinophagales bacterium]
MLIKSLTRTKNPNFSQAIEYVTRAKSKENQVPRELIFTRNFLGKTKADFLKEFIEQEALRKYSREGNVKLHHLILSLHQLDSKNKLPQEMYGDIANHYCPTKII